MEIWVAMNVDADETLVLGAASSIAAAIDFCRVNAGMYDDEGTPSPAEFEKNLALALMKGHIGIEELRFESGVGSWDYRIVKTEATL